MIINRNYERSEHDDFTLCVAPRLNERNEAIEIRDPETEILYAWKIQPRGE